MTPRIRSTIFAGIATLAGSTALASSFETNAWFGYALAAVGAVVAAGVVTRLRPAVPVVLQPLAAMASIAIIATLLFASDTALWGIFPGSEALRTLNDWVQTGSDDIQRLAAPVPPNRGLMLITLLGVGAIAVLVDVIAVVLRRPAVAGLPLLALFVVPAAIVPSGVGWLPFAIGAAGYLALLVSEGHERLGRWGVPLAARTTGGFGATALAAVATPDTAPLARVARRIGFAAVSIAVLLPAAVPGLEGGFLRGSGSGGSGEGGSRSITTYNPLVTLKGDLTLPEPRILLRVNTTDREPGYLRMTVLDRFDGATWSQSQLDATPDERVRRGLPPPQGLSLADTRTVRSTIRVLGLAVPWLPVPYPATRIRAEGDWRMDRASETVFSTRTDTRRLTYEVTTSRVEPSRSLLEGATAPVSRELRGFTELPANLPARISQLTREVTAGADTPYDRVLAIQEYLRSEPFSYSLSTKPGTSGNALLDFLENKQGYCEQYAATMAVMVRAAGVPSRVAVGFTRGRPIGDNYVVTTSEAHAWPEVYFPGAGWLPFEPTPRNDGQALRADYAVPQVEGGGGGPTTAPVPTTGATGGPVPSASASTGDGRNLDEGTANPTGGDPGSGTGRVLTVLALLLVGLALLGATPTVVDTLLRRRRWAGAGTPAELAAVAWQQTYDDAGDTGYRWRDVDSPRAAADRLARERRLTGPALEALRRVAVAEERALYAAVPATPEDVALDVAEVRGALLDDLDRKERLRALVLRPAAMRRTGSYVAGKVADVLDVVDDTGDRVKQTLTGLIPWRRSAG